MISFVNGFSLLKINQSWMYNIFSAFTISHDGQIVNSFKKQTQSVVYTMKSWNSLVKDILLFILRSISIILCFDCKYLFHRTWQTRRAWSKKNKCEQYFNSCAFDTLFNISIEPKKIRTEFVNQTITHWEEEKK